MSDVVLIQQVVSLAAVGLAVDAGATSEAAAACGTAVGLLDELFPAVLAALRHDDDAAAMTVVPFLQVSDSDHSKLWQRPQHPR